MTNEVGDTTVPAPTQPLPLLFSFREKVVGNGFLAEVRMDGRALLEVESNGEVEETWITGVEPVGIAAGGGCREEAFRAFRNAWLTVLFDLAAGTTNFGEFEREVRKFLGSQVASISQRWWDAVHAVRAQQFEVKHLEKAPAERQVVFDVVELALQASLNEVEVAPLDRQKAEMPRVAA